MEFQLSDNVRLRGEKRQWVMERRAQRRRGDKTVIEWKPLGYFASVSAAVRAAAEYDQRVAQDWDDMRGRLNRLTKAIEQVVNEPLIRVLDTGKKLDEWFEARSDRKAC